MNFHSMCFPIPFTLKIKVYWYWFLLMCVMSYKQIIENTSINESDMQLALSLRFRCTLYVIDNKIGYVA